MPFYRSPESLLIEMAPRLGMTITTYVGVTDFVVLCRIRKSSHKIS